MVIILTLFLGLAPFSMAFIAGVDPIPEAHVLEKLKMLANLELIKPLDIFDLLLHSLPWAVLILKTYRTVMPSSSTE